MAKYSKPVHETNRDLLWLRFEGEPLTVRSLPIYELACSFIAIQRLIHKTALFSEGKLERDVHLPARRREALALQVSGHGKGSDLWGLAPYLTDPALGPITQNLITAALVALAAYVYQKIGTKDGPPKNQTLIVNIFQEVKSLTDRIGNIGGVDRIEILAQQDKASQSLIIDSKTQEYVRDLEHRLVPGREMTISGVVTRLLPQSSRLDIGDAPGHYIRVEMDGDLFEKVRRLPVLMEREIKFKGIPFYKLGEITGGIHTFRAHSVILPRNKS